MLYCIICKDRENSLELRAQARPDHLARLEVLQNQGRLVLAGPFPAIDSTDPGPAGFTGSLIVADFDSLEDAQAWANKDPYLAVGAYESATVQPFKQVFPK